ncbi:MAG: purine-binding chemotaxis protein CheW [Planctomycetales bacterium]|nr:purine-binding chemotaxis protein CheW [Planctomycetales bacterium]
MESPEEKSQQSFCTFQVDGFWYGIEVDRVQEVIRTRPTTRVPLAPNGVRGLMNLRGKIVCALDLRDMLGLTALHARSESKDAVVQPECEFASRQMNVVIRSGVDLISLIVDEIGDVVRVTNDGYEPVPGSAGSNSASLLHGAFKLQERLLLILDADRVAAA